MKDIKLPDFDDLFPSKKKQEDESSSEYKDQNKNKNSETKNPSEEDVKNRHSVNQFSESKPKNFVPVNPTQRDKENQFVQPPLLKPTEKNTQKQNQEEKKTPLHKEHVHKKTQNSSEVNPSKQENGHNKHNQKEHQEKKNHPQNNGKDSSGNQEQKYQKEKDFKNQKKNSFPNPPKAEKQSVVVPNVSFVLEEEPLVTEIIDIVGELEREALSQLQTEELEVSVSSGEELSLPEETFLEDLHSDALSQLEAELNQSDSSDFVYSEDGYDYYEYDSDTYDQFSTEEDSSEKPHSETNEENRKMEDNQTLKIPETPSESSTPINFESAHSEKKLKSEPLSVLKSEIPSTNQEVFHSESKTNIPFKQEQISEESIASDKDTSSLEDFEQEVLAQLEKNFRTEVQEPIQTDTVSSIHEDLQQNVLTQFEKTALEQLDSEQVLNPLPEEPSDLEISKVLQEEEVKNQFGMEGVPPDTDVNHEVQEDVLYDLEEDFMSNFEKDALSLLQEEHPNDFPYEGEGVYEIESSLMNEMEKEALSQLQAEEQEINPYLEDDIDAYDLDSEMEMATSLHSEDEDVLTEETSNVEVDYEKKESSQSFEELTKIEESDSEPPLPSEESTIDDSDLESNPSESSSVEDSEFDSDLHSEVSSVKDSQLKPILPSGTSFINVSVLENENLISPFSEKILEEEETDVLVEISTFDSLPDTEELEYDFSEPTVEIFEFEEIQEEFSNTNLETDEKNQNVRGLIRENPKDIIYNASTKWYMTIPRTKRHREESPIFQDLFATLQRKILPFPININTIESFIRYKGILLGISHRPFLSSKFILFGMVSNPVKISIEIIRTNQSDNPSSKDLVLESSFSDKFQIHIESLKDFSIANKILDHFVQLALVGAADCLSEGDKIIINRSGVFFVCEDFYTSDELDKALSILFLLSSNTKYLT